MSISAKLYIEDKVFNVLKFGFKFNQKSSASGYPSAKPTGGQFDIIIESTKDSLFFEWMTSGNMLSKAKIEVSQSFVFGKTRKIELLDVYCLQFQEKFDGINSQPIQSFLRLSPAIMLQDGVKIFEWYWKVTDLSDDVEETVIEQITPSITNVNWIDPETKEIIKEATYNESIALTAQIENQEGSSVTITITKEDGTEFENGKSELFFEESIAEDGAVELTAFKIKEQWEAFKTADIDKLVAKVDHNGYQKKSATIILKPKAKIEVCFSPGSTYDGSDYGLDWMRFGLTTNPGDVFYKDIVGSYHYAKDANGHYLLNSLGEIADPVFTQEDSIYNKLLKKYKRVKHPTNKDDKYVVPVLTLLLNKTAKLSLTVDVMEDAKELTFKFDDELFKLNKSDVTHKVKGKKSLIDYLEIECIKEFNKKQEIEVLADNEFAGKIIVLPNNKRHRYKASILFIEVETAINGIGSNNIGNPIGRDTEFTKYFNQALAQADYSTVSLDLSKDAVFNSSFSSAGMIVHDDKDAIQQYMIDKLYKENDKLGIDYRKHYKIFFVREDAKGLYGASYGVPSKERAVTVYSIGFNDSTLAHETLHAMGLNHPFHEKKLCFERSTTDNIMDYSDFEASPKIPVISTWHRQWKTLWKNLDKE